MKTDDEYRKAFIEKVRIEPDGCWTWLKARRVCHRGTHRYGWMTFRGKQTTAHRVSYTLFVGPIPEKHVVCHKCDNPACVSPEHLFIGTQADNVADMMKKGRVRKGTAIRKIDGKPAKAKLTEESIQTIRKLATEGKSQQAIATYIGVSQTCISKLLRGVTVYAK